MGVTVLFSCWFYCEIVANFFSERKQLKKSQSTEQYTGKRTNEEFWLSSLVGITK